MTRLAALIESASGQPGSPEAERAWQELSRLLHSYVRVRLGTKIRSTAESMDVVQSLLDSLLTDLRAGRLEFGSEDNLRTYLFRMSQRKVTDLLRRAHAQKRGRQQSTLSIGSEPDQLDPPGTDPTASVLARTAEVASNIRRLAGPEDHQIWELRQSGQSWQDIGTLLGLTADAARKRHERLRLLLEQSLLDSSDS